MSENGPSRLKTIFGNIRYAAIAAPLITVAIAAMHTVPELRSSTRELGFIETRDRFALNIAEEIDSLMEKDRDLFAGDRKSVV